MPAQLVGSTRMVMAKWVLRYGVVRFQMTSTK